MHHYDVQAQCFANSVPGPHGLTYFATVGVPDHTRPDPKPYAESKPKPNYVTLVDANNVGAHVFTTY